MADRVSSRVSYKTTRMCRCPRKCVPCTLSSGAPFLRNCKTFGGRGCWQAIFAMPTKPSSSEGTPRLRGWKTRKAMAAANVAVDRPAKKPATKM